MTTTNPAATAPASPAAEPQRYYGFSALVSGFAKMWRATVPAILFIVFNALVQAGLISSNPQVGGTAAFLLPLIASVVMFLLTGVVLASGAYESAAGPARFGAVLGRARSRFVRFLIWVAIATVIATAAALVNPVLSIIVTWVLVYVPIAAVDDQGNPFVANFRAIGRHPFRWFFTGIIIAVFLAVGFLLGAFNTFLVGGPFGSALAMLVGGVFSWWFLTTWACLYRSRVECQGPAPKT